MEENKKDVLPLEGEPLSAPQISTPVVTALAAALSKIETYVPTQYIDDGPPDIDADHLNHAEQAIMRVTNLANGAADAIAALQSQVTQLNNNLSIGKIPNKIFYISPTDDTDCNLLTKHFVLSRGKNFPTGDGFWYIQTIGYEIKPDGTVRTGKQIAYQHIGTKLFTRDCYNDAWNRWAEYTTKPDLDILENRINNTKRADDIEVFADSCNLGLTSFICYAETKGLPSSKYTSGAGLVLKRKQENVTVFLIASSAIIALKCRSEDGWGNWREI